MDTLFLIVGKSTAFIGGFAFIGAMIDMAMRRSERARLKDLMIGWWIRFDSMTWRTFGKAEVQCVIDYIDGHAGRSLLSRKRWTFVARVVAWCAALSIVWTAVLLLFSMDPRGTPSHVITPSPFHLLGLALLIAAFAVSVSLTRAIARAAAALCTNGFTTLLTYAGLLVLHVAILLIWTEGLLQAVLGFAVSALTGAAAPALDASLGYLSNHAKAMLHGDFGALWPTLLGTEPVSLHNAAYTALAVLADLLDLVANGTRILFALVFLLAFLMSRMLKDFISRLWEGIIDADKPVFTIAMGAMGFIALVCYGLLMAGSGHIGAFGPR